MSLHLSKFHIVGNHMSQLIYEQCEMDQMLDSATMQDLYIPLVAVFLFS